MSFSFTVKEEIISSVSNKDKTKACLYGILLFSKILSESQILFQTENNIVAEHFTSAITDILHDQTAVRQSIISKKNNVALYSLLIDDKDNIKRLCEYFNTDLTQENRYIEIKAIGKKKYISFFVAGVFLACGSVNDPLKEYHFEFVIPSNELSSELMELLFSYGMTTKQTERKNAFILYIKESENIEDILTFMGAPKSSLELMNVKILKDVRNKINRAVNCDNANIEKTLNASEKQVESIQLIDEKMGIGNLPEELRDIAVLRLENPDWNLKELAESLNPPISRSGANHRLTRINKIAEELKG